MATYTPNTPVDRLGRGHEPPAPPAYGGGDDGRGGTGPDYGARLRRARLGLICMMAPIIMLFVSLTSTLVFRQGHPSYDERTGTYVHDWGAVQLPWALLAVNTALLLASTVTMEMSRRQITRQAALAPVSSIPGVSLGEGRLFPWLGVTVVLGLGFLTGQGLAWRELQSSGFLVVTNPRTSFVYLLTATHAVHLAGGIIALLWTAVTSLLHKPIEARRIALDITAWYWHLMLVLWVYVFALLGLAK